MEKLFRFAECFYAYFLFYCQLINHKYTIANKFIFCFGWFFFIVNPHGHSNKLASVTHYSYTRISGSTTQDYWEFKDILVVMRITLQLRGWGFNSIWLLRLPSNRKKEKPPRLPSMERLSLQFFFIPIVSKDLLNCDSWRFYRPVNVLEHFSK